MNVSDAERAASVFNSHGFSLTSSEAEADIIIAFACSVREKAVHKILGKINEWQSQISNVKSQNHNSNLKSKDKFIIVTGCILESDKKKLSKKVDLVFEIKDIQELEEFLNKELYPKSLKNPKNIIDSKNYLDIQPSYSSKVSAYLPIMTGCDNFCSYCAVPHTRGHEVSRPEEDILREVEELVKKGYKEITLLGQNVNSYGIKDTRYSIFDIEEKEKNIQYPVSNISKQSKFVSLLQKIDLFDGDHWIRFYANHPKDFGDELIDFLKNSKHFCHYIHLPLQSGDDEVLKKMNRHYTAKQYLKIIKKIRKEIPDCAITTDIIVGFPGETEKQFQNTVKLLEKAGFDMIFISEYSPRPGTVAAKMEDDVSHAEKERRKRYLNDEVLARSVLKNNKKLVGKKVRVLIYKKVHSASRERRGKKGFFIGRTEGLKDVRISSEETLPLQIGNFVDIKITKANSWGLEGGLSKQSK